MFAEENRLTTCNKQGPIGPHMEECAKVYKYYNTKVSIGGATESDHDEHLEADKEHDADKLVQIGYSTGIQRWIAPLTGIYT